MLTRGRLASTMENFKPSFLAALEDEEIVERYKLIFEPMFKTLMLPVTSKLTDTVAMLSQSITSLKKEVEEKDSIIRELQGSVSRLQVTVDDLEQHGRRESIRVFGLPETTPGSTDDKVLQLVNNRMKLFRIVSGKSSRWKKMGLHLLQDLYSWSSWVGGPTLGPWRFGSSSGCDVGDAGMMMAEMRITRVSQTKKTRTKNERTILSHSQLSTYPMIWRIPGLHLHSGLDKQTTTTNHEHLDHWL